MGSLKPHGIDRAHLIRRISRLMLLPLLAFGLSLPSVAPVQAGALDPVVSSFSSSFSTYASGVVGGRLAGGDTVTITGSKLTGIIGVTVGGVAATDVTGISDTSARFITPGGASNIAYDVVVTTNDGSVTKVGAFTYLSTNTCGTSGNFYIGANVVTHSVSCVGSLTVPEGVTSIADKAFCNNINSCTRTFSALGAISLPTTLVTIGTAAFMESWATSVVFTLPSSLTTIGYQSFTYTSISSVVIPKSVTRIAGGAFYKAGSLSSVTFEEPSSLTSIGVEGGPNGSGPFMWTRLTTLTLPASVTRIGSFFKDTPISTLVLKGNVTTIDSGALPPTSPPYPWYGQSLPSTGFTVIINSTNSSYVNNYAYTAPAPLVVTSVDSITPASTIASISPSSGLITGGTSVRLRGTNLNGVNKVYVKGQLATSLSVESSTSLTFTTPAGAAGASDIWLNGSSGPTIGTSLFTYLSTNPKLSALLLNNGATLSPTFSGTTTSYTASVAGSVNSVNVTPTSAAGASIKVNGTTVASGTATTVSGLVTGENTIRIVTTAQDAVTMETYTVVVTKASSLSTDAKLSALTISSGTLSPSFDSATVLYTASVTNAITSITVTPTVNQANATVTVNGTTVASASASGSINLNVGSNTITVLNTAQDGTTTKTYTVTVTRAPPAPTISSIDNSTPNYGATVRVTGANFTGATSVQIGSTPVATFTVESSTSLTFVVNSSCCTASAVSVTTSGGTGTSGTNITPQPQLPVITTQPQAATTSVGQSVTLTVVATSPADSGTLSYQWLKGGSTISGATSATYTFTPAAIADAGNYSVVVYNTISSTSVSTTSNTAALTVNKGTPSLSTFGSITKYYGDTNFLVTAPTASVLGTYTYTSSDVNVATVSGSTISVVAPGTSTITATFTPQNTTDYNSGGTITALLTVDKATQGSLTVTSTAGTVGIALTLTTTGGSGTGAVTFSTSTAGCSVSGSAPYTLSSNAERTCAVIATKSSDANYLSATSSSTNIVITAIRYSVTYNGNLNGGGSVPTDATTYITGESVTVLSPGTLSRSGYSFIGWTTNPSDTSTLFLNPATILVNSANISLHAVWRANQYVVTYVGNGGTPDTATATFTTGTTALVLPTPTRANFTFSGWYTASSNGTLIGLAGANYSPIESSTVHAQWVQNSLAGLPAGSLSFINSYQVSQLITVTSTFSTAGNTVSLVVPAGALPSGTSVTYWLLSSEAQQAAPLPGQNDFVLSMVVSWLNSDGTVPDAASGKPLVMTITNSAIKSGASVYSVVGSSATLLGVATQDGEVSVNLTTDPQIYVVQPKAVSSNNIVNSSTPTMLNQSVKISSALIETGPVSGGNILRIPGTFTISGSCSISSIFVANQILSAADWSVTSSELTILMPANIAGLTTIKIYNGCEPTLSGINYLYAEAALIAESPKVIDKPIAEATPVANIQPTSSMKKIATYYFASGATSLTKAQLSELAKLAKKINTSGAKTVLVYGYSDSMPSPFNSAVSKKRASTTEVFLTKLVKGKILRIGWYGSSKPLVSGNSPKDNAKNRRVEIWTK